MRSQLQALNLRKKLPSFLVLCALCSHGVAQSRPTSRNVPVIGVTSPAASDSLTAAAFGHFYNMEYDRSVQEFEKILEQRPGDPAAVNHLLTSVLMRELVPHGGDEYGGVRQ